jgi:hypothetical protein
MKQNKSENEEVLEILAKEKKKFWTEAENLRLEEAIKKHGIDKDQIHKMVPTRTVT